MSIVTVQLGQCGNQIGSQFFNMVANDLQSLQNSCLFNDYEEECFGRFFSLGDSGKWTARAVMLDTEPKVVLHNHFFLFVCFIAYFCSLFCFFIILCV